EVADIPSLQVNAMTLVERAHNPNKCVRTWGLSAMCCLRNEQRREQSPDENSHANNPGPGIHHFSPSQCLFRHTGGGNPSEAGRAICDIDTSKYASRIVHPCE